MDVKAIETKYKGYRFRSRLEARWAVFFDALGVRWEYEPEGFELPSGWYLPDFLLTYADSYKVWAEVKPEGARLSELPELRDLCLATHQFVVLLAGTPGVQTHFEYHSIACLIENARCLVWSKNRRPWLGAAESDSYVGAPGYLQAVEAARSARFEHGETPCPR